MHIPPVQLFGATHGYGNAAGFVQQMLPRAPQGVHDPETHARLVPHVLPAQHASPLPPQLAHVLPLHSVPARQLEAPAQHG